MGQFSLMCFGMGVAFLKLKKRKGHPPNWMPGHPFSFAVLEIGLHKPG